jgi:hypothetical protein
MTIRVVASFFVKNMNAASDATAALEMADYETITSQHFDACSPTVFMEAFRDVAGNEVGVQYLDEVMDEVNCIIDPLGGDCWLVDQLPPHMHKPFHDHDADYDLAVKAAHPPN